MKKLLCILLAAIMVCGCLGCSQSNTEQAPASNAAAETTGNAAKLQVGYGRKDITPMDPVPLAGYGNSFNRISKGALDYLYVTCVAIADGEGNTVLLLSEDLLLPTFSPEARQQISTATGIPLENIVQASTHTHSAPDQASTDPAIATWKVRYLSQCVKAAEEALADLSPAEISVGSTNVEGLNFVRHYLLNDGTYAGDNFGDWSSGIKDYADVKDTQMQLIRFTRAAEDKKDVVMANWQAHACVTGGNEKYDISADFIGSTRAYVEQQADVNFIYFSGAGGNLNSFSRIAADTPTKDNKEYGMQLGNYALDVMKNMTPVQSGAVKVKITPFVGQVDKTFQDKLTQAKEVVDLMEAAGQLTANVKAVEYGFSSCFHAQAVVRRSSMSDTQTFDLCTISVGDISFVAAPYEMFAVHGMHIKENSPFQSTFVLTCANAYVGYLPTNEAYDYGCYESHSGRYVRGTGDELAEAFVTALTELK